MRAYIQMDGDEDVMPVEIREGCTFKELFCMGECQRFLGVSCEDFPGTLCTLNGVVVGVPERMADAKVKDGDVLGFQEPSGAYGNQPTPQIVNGSVDICLKDSNIFCQVDIVPGISVKDALYSDTCRGTFRMTDEAISSCRIFLNNSEIQHNDCCRMPLRSGDQLVLYPGLTRRVMT